MKNKIQDQEPMILQKKIAEIYDRFKPAPDDEATPSPWSLLVQTALERTTQHISTLEFFARFNPAIWDLIGNRFSAIADSRYLNPQPIPPRWLFARELAKTVVERVQFISDISEGLQKGSAVKSAGNFIAQFTDGICPDPPKIKIPKGWPWPEPDPDPRWSATELAAIAEVFVKESFQSNLQNIYLSAAAKIVDIASGRKQ